jgi:hypothetical protein
MGAFELMCYTITITLIIFTTSMLVLVYQVTLSLTMFRKLITDIESIPVKAQLAVDGLQIAVMSAVLKFLGGKGGA